MDLSVAQQCPEAPPPLGTLAEVRERLAALFPRMEGQASGRPHFGRSLASEDGGTEFQVAGDDDGLCRFLTVRQVLRAEVERLCRALDVVAVDVQKMEVIRP